jgi:hypothetical protein
LVTLSRVPASSVSMRYDLCFVFPKAGYCPF